MQNSKNSKEVPGTGIAQQKLQEQFNIATKELFNYSDYPEFRETINNLLTGWLSTDHIENTTKEERVNIYTFFSELLIHIDKTSLIYEKDNNSIFPLELYEKLLFIDFKTCKSIFEEVVDGFINSGLADNNQTRIVTYYVNNAIKEYVFELHKSKRKLSTLNT